MYSLVETLLCNCLLRVVEGAETDDEVTLVVGSQLRLHLDDL